ncbi:MAG: hypothetical protein ACFCAD_08530 [Pleurocapsa sp.]
MATQITNIENLERKQLLKLAEEYRENGYKISFCPNPEDLPDFLKNYRPDLIDHRYDENVVIEVKSRHSLDSSSNQYLRNLAQQIEQHPGWRFELVMINSEEATYLAEAKETLQESEIKSRLKIVQKLSEQHSESGIILAWTLIEATLRLVAEREQLSLSKINPLYLIKLLTTEGIISRLQYQLLMDSYSLRSTIVHGFKNTKSAEVNQDIVNKLIKLIEDILGQYNQK